MLSLGFKLNTPDFLKRKPRRITRVHFGLQTEHAEISPEKGERERERARVRERKRERERERSTLPETILVIHSVGGRYMS